MSTVDVTVAGEGQLEIMVNKGAVPNTVKMLRKGVFLVTFVPQDTRNHVVDIKFNGQLLPRKYLLIKMSSHLKQNIHGGMVIIAHLERGQNVSETLN